jgi:hypothetical protein
VRALRPTRPQAERNRLPRRVPREALHLMLKVRVRPLRSPGDGRAIAGVPGEGRALKARPSA